MTELLPATKEKPRIRVNGADGQILPESLGAFRGAEQNTRELGSWVTRALSGDAAVLPEKERLSSRSSDIWRNNGYASRVIQVRVDSIIGHHFKLSYKPNWRVLGIDPDSEEAARFVHDVESMWSDYAEDPECKIDAEGKRTFTQLIRDGARADTLHGEILRTAEWIRRPGFQTAIKVVNPDRLSNPDFMPDTFDLRAGVLRDSRGAAKTYYFREIHPSDARFGFSDKAFSWKPVRKQLPWGRLQVIHVFDPVDDGATRGVPKFAPILERFKMLDKYQGVVLQAAVLNAMYALVIESEFDTVTALEALGAGDDSGNDSISRYLKNVAEYHEGADIRFNGVKIPHLFPNEKLNMLKPEGPETAEYEDRLLRYMAAGSNLSYEQLASNWSQTNFSSAKASLGEAWRYFLGEREMHKRHATMIFALWLEEAFSKGKIRPPRGTPNFWDAKSAWCRSDWIGAGRSMIDGLKETKELILKLEAGLITYEKACAQLGEDYKELFDQQVREINERKAAGLPPPSWMQTQTLSPDPSVEEPGVNDNAQTS